MSSTENEPMSVVAFVSRDHKIWRERVFGQRTLQAIANEHGISRERVRQIVDKVAMPVVIRNIHWTRGTFNCLCNENLTKMFLAEFVEYARTNDLRRIPNLGKIRLREIKTKLGKHGYVLPDGY